VFVCVSERDREAQKGRPCPGIGSKRHRKNENNILLTMLLFKASRRIWQMLKAHLRPATHQLITNNLHVIIPVKTQTPFVKWYWERSEIRTGLVRKTSEEKPLVMLDLHRKIILYCNTLAEYGLDSPDSWVTGGEFLCLRQWTRAFHKMREVI